MRNSSLLSLFPICTALSLVVAAQPPSINTFQDLLTRAESSTRLKQWTEASAQWSQVVAANPHVASYWNQLGIVLVNAKDYRAAIRAYQKAMDLGLANCRDSSHRSE